LALLDEIAAKRTPAPMTEEELVARKEQEKKNEQMQAPMKQSDAERYSDLWFAVREGRNLPPVDVAFMERYEATAPGQSVKNTLELLNMGQDTG